MIRYQSLLIRTDFDIGNKQESDSSSERILYDWKFVLSYFHSKLRKNLSDKRVFGETKRNKTKLRSNNSKRRRTKNQGEKLFRKDKNNGCQSINK